jgi:ABC-type transporter Mla MlaB component
MRSLSSVSSSSSYFLRILISCLANTDASSMSVALTNVNKVLWNLLDVFGLLDDILGVLLCFEKIFNTILH